MAVTVDLASRTYTGSPSVSSVRRSGEDIRKQAIEDAKKDRPDLFRTREEISLDARKAADQRGLTGTSRSKWVTNQVETQMRGQAAGQSQVLSAFLRDADSKEEKRAAEERVTAAAEQRRQDSLRAAEQSRQDALTKTAADKEGAITKSDRSGLNQMEVMQGAKYAGSQQATADLVKVKDYFQRLKEDPDRENIIKEFQARASDLVDKPYNEKITRLQDRLIQNVKEANEKFGVITESQQFALEKTIRTLDSSAASSLSDNLDSLIRRGGMNSGLLMSFANDIITQRDQSASDAQRETDLALKSSGLVKDAAIASAEYSSKDDIGEQEMARDTARGVMTEKLQKEYSEVDLLEQEKARNAMGGQDSTQGLPGAANAAGDPTAGKGIADIRMPQAGAIPNDSINQARQARQAASQTITLDQAAQMKNMNSSQIGTAARLAERNTSLATARAPTPAPVLNSSQIGTASRLAARRAKLPKSY